MPVMRIPSDEPAPGEKPKARRRGSQPGVARGPYKPRALQRPEPTPEQMERWCREYWGDDWYDRNVHVVDDRTHEPVSVRRYLPPDSIFSPYYGKAERVASGTKKCRGCGAEMALNDFGPNGRGGLKAQCKACLAEAARKYAHSPDGKPARSRAKAKYMAAVRAREETLAARERFVAHCLQSEPGRALLAALDFETKPLAPQTDC